MRSRMLTRMLMGFQSLLCEGRKWRVYFLETDRSLARIREKKFLEAPDLVLHAEVPRRGHVLELCIQLFQVEDQALKLAGIF